MKTEYNGIEITYDEGRNEWLFELRGRSRKADSLTLAKEAIDKEPKEKRAQTFPRFEAYFKHYSGWQKVIVTSIAEDPYYRGSGKSFWILGSGGKRSKESDSGLFPVNDHNTALLDAIHAKEKDIEVLEQQKSALYEKLQKATVPQEIA